jgi:hypothetical protein
MDSGTLRLVCAALALLFGAVLFLRRKSRKAE